MQQAKRHYSVDEYFGIEEMSEVRHDYFDGEIFAMSGGSLNHNQILKNLSRALDATGDPRCRSYLADVRVKTPAGLYTYPDVMVICGPPTYSSDHLPAVTNLVVVAEVLSHSTRDYDAGQKFDLYCTIPTLRDYLLVDQYTVSVEHRFAQGARWQSTRYPNREDAIQLTGVSIALRIDEIYRLVDFLPAAHDH